MNLIAKTDTDVLDRFVFPAVYLSCSWFDTMKHKPGAHEGESMAWNNLLWPHLHPTSLGWTEAPTVRKVWVVSFWSWLQVNHSTFHPQYADQILVISVYAVCVQRVILRHKEHVETRENKKNTAVASVHTQTVKDSAVCTKSINILKSRKNLCTVKMTLEMQNTSTGPAALKIIIVYK